MKIPSLERLREKVGSGLSQADAKRRLSPQLNRFCVFGDLRRPQAPPPEALSSANHPGGYPVPAVHGVPQRGWTQHSHRLANVHEGWQLACKVGRKPQINAFGEATKLCKTHRTTLVMGFNLLRIGNPSTKCRPRLAIGLRLDAVYRVPMLALSFEKPLLLEPIPAAKGRL